MPAGDAPAIDYKWLVQDDRIHASLYTDPRVFADEMERIFHRGWVFVGHDSEVPRPGDFVTRRVGTEPVIMVRDGDGRVAVLVNRCMHRGTMVCAADRGHARTFTCPYHGWTYDLAGTLLGVPYPGGYAALDKSAHGLTQAAARRGLSRLRLREPEPRGHHARRASGRRHPAHRPLVRSRAGGRGGAVRRLGQASLRRELEDAPRERQRRLSPRLRSSRPLPDHPHPVSARGGRRADDQGGGARLGRRAHRDRLVARLRAPVRVARRRGRARPSPTSRPPWSGATGRRWRAGASWKAPPTR